MIPPGEWFWKMNVIACSHDGWAWPGPATESPVAANQLPSASTATGPGWIQPVKGMLGTVVAAIAGAGAASTVSDIPRTRANARRFMVGILLVRGRPGNPGVARFHSKRARV